MATIYDLVTMPPRRSCSGISNRLVDEKAAVGLAIVYFNYFVYFD